MELSSILGRLNIQTRYHDKRDKAVIKLQSIFRCALYRRNNLPNSILTCKRILAESNLICASTISDGRINSILDEDTAITMLQKSLGARIWRPNDRHWFDFSIMDYTNGELPVNIKSTKGNTADNTANLAAVVYSITNEDLRLHKQQNNGPVSRILIDKLKTEELNTKIKKDYYFLVINKISGDIIANSIRGLVKLTANINNLPFQIKWNNNTTFKYQHVSITKDKIISAIKHNKPGWRETFLCEMRNIK